MDSSEISEVEDQGLYANSCGYCKSQGPTSFAYGLWAYSLSPYDYQELLNRSWRRSGMFLYRPELEMSCCAAYTIRLKADSMKTSVEHARVMRRMKSYLDGVYNGHLSSKMDSKLPMMNAGDGLSIATGLPKQQIRNSRLKEGKLKVKGGDNIADVLTAQVYYAIKDCIMHGDLPDYCEFSKIRVQRLEKNLSRRGRKLLEGKISYTCTAAFPCAVALLRQENSFKLSNSVFSKYKGANKSEEKAALSEVATLLADTIACRLQESGKMNRFRVQACKGHLNFTAVSLDPDPCHEINLCPASNIISGISDHKLNNFTEQTISTNNLQSVKRESFVKNRRVLEIRTRHSCFDSEEFSLYRRYQIAIHGDKPENVTEVSYRRFLVDTPLPFIPLPRENGGFPGFGSFHQQYLIDGRLVAVGVIDILPSCLSSNYFFWDPDFAFLSLGKYSALKEIEWVQEAKNYCETLEYYYLGHYIHSCPKMRYKVTFRPSELLCPFELQWVPFDIIHPLLDEQASVRLLEHLQAARSAECQDNTVKMADDDATNMMTAGDSNEQALERLDVENSDAVNDIAKGDNLNRVLLRFGHKHIQFEEARKWLGLSLVDQLESKLEEYIGLVGESLAARMAYVLT